MSKRSRSRRVSVECPLRNPDCIAGIKLLASRYIDSCILIDDISDHLPIMLCIDLFLTTSRVSTTPNKRIFNDKGKDAFRQLLQLTDWSTIEQLADSEGPDVAYASFISKYKSLYRSEE